MTASVGTGMAMYASPPKSPRSMLLEFASDNAVIELPLPQKCSL